jgi:hypothetical protein
MKTLNDETSGRFLVLTESGSRYDIDLDACTFQRVPAFDMAHDRSLRRDGEAVTLLEMRDCTVGRRAVFLVDLGWPGVLFTRRETTAVVAIERQRHE